MTSSPHVRITINGETVLDDHLGEWQRKPPAQLQAMAMPKNQPPQPGMKALLISLAEAAATNQPLTADLQSSDTGFILKVDTTPTHQTPNQ